MKNKIIYKGRFKPKAPPQSFAKKKIKCRQCTNYIIPEGEMCIRCLECEIIALTNRISSLEDELNNISEYS